MNDEVIPPDAERSDDLIARATGGELTAAELESARSDPAIAAELDQALDAAAALQHTLATPPPPHLRDSVLAAIADEPQEDDDHRSDSGHVGGPSAPERDHRRSTVPDRRSSVTGDELAARRRRRRAGGLLGLAAAALLLVGAAVVLTDGDGAPDEIAAVVDADDRVVRPFDGAIGGELELVYSPSAGAVVLTGTGLEEVPPDFALQLWLVDEDGAVPVGTFRPDDGGAVSTRFDGVDPTDVVLGVTREPAGGSDTPTLPILATA